MTTVELLEQALGLARRNGYKVREEYLDDCMGGACVIKGQKLLFLDPAQGPREQLEAVLNALWAEITRTASTGARVIFRTAAEPSLLPGRVSNSLLDQWRYEDEASREFSARDRSAIYGGFHLYIMGDSP